MSLADFQQPTRDLLAELGEPVTVVRGTQPAQLLQAFVDDAVQTIGQRGTVYANKRTVTTMNVDWIFARADVVTARGRTAKVEEVLADDGICNTVVLHG